MTIWLGRSISKTRKSTNWANNSARSKISAWEICRRSRIFKRKSVRSRGSWTSRDPWRRSNRWVGYRTISCRTRSRLTLPRSTAVASSPKETLFRFHPETAWAPKSRREALRKSVRANYNLTNSSTPRRSAQMAKIKMKASSACWETGRIPNRVRAIMRT